MSMTLYPKRESRDSYFLRLVREVATRTTCFRRAVGCILVDKHGHVLATGYNGVPRGFDHCSEGHLCSGAELPAGQAGTMCKSIHAEQNALLQCKDTEAVHTCYVTCNPCDVCIKLLLNTSCQRIVFIDDYPSEAKADWLKANREWIKGDIL